MINFFADIIKEPEHFRQFSCGDSLISLYDCPLEGRFVDVWANQNYIIYVLEGKKIWHTPNSSYELQKGSCVFVRKGAHIVEQFFNPRFCLLVFFFSDDFLCDTLKSRSKPIKVPTERKYEPIYQLEKTETLETFFHSMSLHFANKKEPDRTLLELKFRELILTVADNPQNENVLSYFYSVVNEPRSASLQRIMEENYCYNLKLEDYAELSNRSLSAFKRDFQKQFNTTPGKWLLEKKLHHARHLLSNMDKTVSEAAFESGFENPSHFSRSFKERFGFPPAAVKQERAI
jgi:AraC family transcriptional regulator, exoenzyme S synthesis regulatory protein ExsA